MNTLNINLDDITVFNDIRLRLAAVTPEMLETATRRLRPSKNEVIGSVDNMATRALFALYGALQADSRIALAQARSGMINPEEEKDLNERAVMLDVLSDVCRELFWAQAKQDIGLYENENISVKQGWTLVREKSSSGHQAFLDVIRGTISGGEEDD